MVIHARVPRFIFLYLQSLLIFPNVTKKKLYPIITGIPVLANQVGVFTLMCRRYFVLKRGKFFESIEVSILT